MCVVWAWLGLLDFVYCLFMYVCCVFRFVVLWAASHSVTLLLSEEVARTKEATWKLVSKNNSRSGLICKPRLWDFCVVCSRGSPVSVSVLVALYFSVPFVCVAEKLSETEKVPEDYVKKIFNCESSRRTKKKEAFQASTESSLGWVFPSLRSGTSPKNPGSR